MTETTCEPPGAALTLGELLLISRRRANLTALDLAGVCAVTANTVGAWERDRSRPSRLHLEAWARAVDWPIDQFQAVPA